MPVVDNITFAHLLH